MKNKELLKEIMITYLSNNKVPPEKLHKLIENVSHALDEAQNMQDRPVKQMEKIFAKNTVKKLGRPPKLSKTKTVPQQKDSAHKVTCMKCGKQFASLRRHLNETHDMTPQEYRKKYNLSDDYPMVAPAVVKKMSQARKKVLAEKKIAAGA